MVLLPSPSKWVADQVELYEGSNGTQGTTLRDTGMPVILVTNTGRRTGERKRLWGIAVTAYPPYAEYQTRTGRLIPVLVAEPAD